MSWGNEAEDLNSRIERKSATRSWTMSEASSMLGVLIVMTEEFWVSSFLIEMDTGFPSLKLTAFKEIFGPSLMTNLSRFYPT